jgi:hypothetical protein
MGSSRVENGGDLIGDTTDGDTTCSVGTWAREEVDRAGRNRDRAPHGKSSHPGLLWVNFKSIMQNPWRWPIFRHCILLWEFANNNKCQVNYAKPFRDALIAQFVYNLRDESFEPS